MMAGRSVLSASYTRDDETGADRFAVSVMRSGLHRRGTNGLHDSPLEGDGFEPSVPRSPMSSVGAACRSCLRGSGSGSALLFPRLEPLRRAGLGHGLSRLWLAGLRGGFRLLVVQLIYTFALHRLNQQFAERPDQGINAVRRIPRRGRSIFAWWRHTASNWCRTRRSRRLATPPI